MINIFPKKELHLIIIWENGRYKEKEIVNSISKKFELVEKYRVNWRDIRSMNNLSTTSIKPGQKLQIPTQGYDEYMKSLLTSNSTKKNILYG